MSARRRTVLLVVVAVLGIALAAGITWGTSQLVRQRIGLAFEPLTAGRRLLPPVGRTPAPAKTSPRSSTTTTPPRTGSSPSPSPTSSQPQTTAIAPGGAPPSPSPGSSSVGSAPAGAPATGGDSADSARHQDD
jgi:hypothetical protein